MPDLALEREAIALFEGALDIAPGEREAWLQERAKDRPELLARVRAMFAADSEAFLHTGTAADSVETEEEAPERIGAYRLVERIGRGGMGSVYLGERDSGDFAHRAAIKIIKPGLLSDSLVERFRRERQLLATLTHPHISQLYDGGETEAGFPYFIMEYVDGLPLLHWVEVQRPSLAERRRLFGDICAAVAFAHRNLVVHRDLTPSNVLVTRSGVAKLIDFGIARLADETGARRDSSGASIASLSLTPGYAAPERMTSGEVTTAADIYSLGKLLEKLIPPEGKDRELNAIVARATATDPAARYPTADALGADVAAWSSGMPVAAVDGGRRYAAAKFIARHRIGVAAAALAVLLLVGAFALTLNAYGRAEASRRAEAARFDELRSLARYMLFELNGSLERVVGNTQARASLARRAQHYLSALAASPAADDGLKLEAAQGLIALARAQGVPTQPNLGDSDQARRNLKQAISMLRELDMPPSAKAPDLAEGLAAAAMIQAHVDSIIPAAEAQVKEAAALLAAVPDAERSAQWHAARRRLRLAEAEMATLGQKPDQLLLLAGRMEADIDQWPDAMRASRDAGLDRAYANYFRGLHGYFTDALVPAVTILRKSEGQFAALERSLPNDPITLYAQMWNAYLGYGAASGLPGRTADAEHFLDLAIRTSGRLIAIEANDHSLRSFAGNLRQAQSQALSARGDRKGAMAAQREVIQLYESALGQERRASPLNRLATAQVTMGNIARAAGDPALACSSYRAARNHVEELQRRGKLIGTVEAYRSNLDANLARCAKGAPLSEMAIFG